MRRKALAAVMAGFLMVLFLVAAASAEVRLPALFGDNMVIQADKPVPVWGWAEPGETITVAACGKTVTGKAAADGRWQVCLPATKPGGPMEITIKDATSSRTLANVLVGEVWIGSGQSNMEWSVDRSLDPEKEIAAARYPKIRLFVVEHKTSDKPEQDCKGEWVECSPESVGRFSAVAYFFGRELHKELGVPVGLIKTAWGGTPAESWISGEALQSQPSLKPLLERWEQQIANYPKVEPVLKKNYEQQLERWKKAVAKARAEKKPIPRGPQPPQDPKDSPHRPANLYNGMIAPLLPCAFRGAIWYQGESNVSRAWQYRTIFPLMICDWRDRWSQGNFPFGLVQLAPFRYGGQDPASCAELREAQALVLKTLPATGMAVTTDIGDVRDIHPKNKQEVGRRLALWALATAYGRDVVYQGPTYKSMAVEGGKIRVRFDHAESGLVTRDGKPADWFTIAGADQKFCPATAEIQGETIVVSSPEVTRPVAVRFGWNDTAEPNLANKTGLPAPQFRTDSWKYLTEGQN